MEGINLDSKMPKKPLKTSSTNNISKMAKWHFRNIFYTKIFEFYDFFYYFY